MESNRNITLDNTWTDVHWSYVVINPKCFEYICRYYESEDMNINLSRCIFNLYINLLNSITSNHNTIDSTDLDYLHNKLSFLDNLHTELDFRPQYIHSTIDSIIVPINGQLEQILDKIIMKFYPDDKVLRICQNVYKHINTTIDGSVIVDRMWIDIINFSIINKNDYYVDMFVRNISLIRDNTNNCDNNIVSKYHNIFMNEVSDYVTRKLIFNKIYKLCRYNELYVDQTEYFDKFYLDHVNEITPDLFC